MKQKFEVTKAYRERNNLLQFFSKLYPSHLCISTQKPLPKEWKIALCVHTPKGAMTWHIHESELDKFEHLVIEANHYDGMPTKEKYKRLSKLPCQE